MAANLNSADDEFAQRLILRELLTPEELARASAARTATGDALHHALERLGIVREEDLLAELADHLNIRLFTRDDMPDEPVLPSAFSTDFLRERRLLPLSVSDQAVAIACCEPTDATLRASLEFHLERPVEFVLASHRDLEWAFNFLYSDITRGNDSNQSAPADDIETLKSLAAEQPVIRFVNRLIEEAVERRASDIHLEPEHRITRIRFRVDGVLLDTTAPTPSMAPAITSRLKIMAGLDIAERRLPQDGRIRTTVRGVEIDLRISTIPTLHGEGIVARLLDKSAVTLEFPALGFNDQALKRYKQFLREPNGIVLVTGPTGSGKTTTLYTSLLALNDGKRKIISVEDPVEYELGGINQIAAHPQIGLTFAKALRSILRHDPDVIMIGEIRDLETAEIAIQASLTGHLVLATLHTNSAAATLTRLMDMGVEHYMLSSTILGVAAQRLVRNICPHCRVPDDNALKIIQEVAPNALARTTQRQPMRATGCEHCRQTGYHGRSSILEVMPIDNAIRELIMDRASEGDLQAQAASANMQTMFEAGIEKVLQGITSMDEVLRVARAP